MSSADHLTPVNDLGADREIDRGPDHRLLIRLGLDLHDGPLQEVAAINTELHFFREQLATALGERVPAVRSAEDLIQRIDDLADHLRDLAVSASAPELLEHPLSQSLKEVIDLHSDSCDIELALEPSRSAVDTAPLTDSQRIAIVRVVREALANVAQHSGAFSASVTVSARLDGIALEVMDNGCGFEPGPAQPGHIGLAGMHQRLALLGGKLTIASRKGGPTVLVAFLPRWHQHRTDDR